MANDDKTVRKRVVDLHDHVKNGWLEGWTFLECEIRGPAVLFFRRNVSFDHNTMDADLDSILWEIPATRTQVSGAVGVNDTTFKDCTMLRIGIAATEHDMPMLRAGFQGAKI